MAVSLQIEGVSKFFGATRAVDDITLAIEPGELFFLLGPSGCGKTTLLRCIAGFCEPDRGAIRIGGEDITRRPAYRRDTGRVFQSYALWPHMTVRENVAFGLELRRLPRKEIRARADAALDLVRMADRADHRPNQLSGGQQQRVALARALAMRPRCLLLDEPLSNLDARLRMEMRAEIRSLCKQAGLTTVYVTHDQQEALCMADRLSVLRNGRIEQLGRPQEVYRRPANRFVAHFIGEANFVAGQLRARTDDALEIETPFGPLRAAAENARDLPAAGAVTLAIRPEYIRIGQPPPGAPNRFDAILHDTVYQGELAEHQVDLAGPAGTVTTLKLFELNPRVVARDAHREPTRVWIAPEDIVTLGGG